MERKGERVGAIVLLNDVYARLLQQSLKDPRGDSGGGSCPWFHRYEMLDLTLGDINK